MNASPPEKPNRQDWSNESEELVLMEGDVLQLPNGREVRIQEEVKITFTRRNVHAATD